AADLLDAVKRRGDPSGNVERLTGGEHMARVQADPSSRVEVEDVEIACQVVDSGAERAALPGGGLEKQPGTVVTEPFEDREQTVANPVHCCIKQARITAGIDKRPRVDNDALAA